MLLCGFVYKILMRIVPGYLSELLVLSHIFDVVYLNQPVAKTKYYGDIHPLYMPLIVDQAASSNSISRYILNC